MQLIFVCLGLAAFVTLGSSLKCYQCNNCKANFTKSGGKQCQDADKRCVKQIFDNGTISRKCGTADDCKSPKKECVGDEVKPCAICCDTDDCNDATVFHISVFAIGLVAALHKFLF